MSIRQLKPGEKLPRGEPRRYRAGHGYIRLRWHLGDGKYLETYEHRVEGDHVTTADCVHHKNHVRDDNAADNLAQLTAEEHHELHGSPMAEQCIDLYRQGHGTVTIGRMVGLHHSNVFRLLQRRGLLERRRKTAFYARPMPSDEQLREWHADGVRVARMVAMSKVGRKRLERRLDVLGLDRFPPGRHPQEARETGWLTFRKDLP